LKINNNRALYAVAAAGAVLLTVRLAFAGLFATILLFLPFVAVVFVVLLNVRPRSMSDGTTASRSKRTGAALIDIVSFVLLFDLALIPIRSLLYHGAPGVGPEVFVIFPGVGFAIYLLLSLIFAKQGQSVGKKAMGIQVVGLEGRPVSMLRFTFRRVIPIFFILLVSWLFLGIPLLVDFALGLFREDRRCGHDFIAGTKVVAYRATGNTSSRSEPKDLSRSVREGGTL
jgi:uncharacterized RDD family membrane protein YckC